METSEGKRTRAKYPSWLHSVLYLFVDDAIGECVLQLICLKISDMEMRSGSRTRTQFKI